MFARQHHSELRLLFLSFLINKVWFLPSCAVIDHPKRAMLANTLFGGKKKKNNNNKNQAKLSMHREHNFAFKAIQSMCTQLNFSVHLTYFTPKNALILQPVVHTSSRRRISAFPPQLALHPGQLTVFSNTVKLTKKLWEGRGKSCRGLNKLCMFTAQTHCPMLILLNHMHTLARRLLQTFSGTRSEWL